MTNAMIIFTASQELAKDGKIKYTGNEFKAVDSTGKEITYKETEEIHTYAIWKEMGYQVSKGQKAVAKIMIWKHTGKKEDSMVDSEGNEAHYIDKGHMFMKTAAFFSRSQVEEIA